MKKTAVKKTKQEDVVPAVKEPLVDTKSINGFWKDTLKDDEDVSLDPIGNIFAFIVTFLVVTFVLALLFGRAFAAAWDNSNELLFLLPLIAFPIFIFIAQKTKKISKGMQWGILTPIILILIALIILFVVL